MPDFGGDPVVARTLQQGLEQLGLTVTPPQLEALDGYLSLLQRWNKAYNLTSVRDPLGMVQRHLLDSLSIAGLLPAAGRRIADVGSGGGLPGIPLAILFPERTFELLDGNGKKARFLFQVKTELGLANMASRHVRAEAWQPEHCYDVVLSRAFASLADMVSCCAHMLGQHGTMLAMKGQFPEAEIAQLGDAATVLAVHRLEVPGLSEARHVVELQPTMNRRRQDQTG